MDDGIQHRRLLDDWTPKRPSGQDAEYRTEQLSYGRVPDGYSYLRHIYVEADARLLMEKWLILGLGHAWSGSPKPSRYGDPKGPNASAEIWRFFCEASSRL